MCPVTTWYLRTLASSVMPLIIAMSCAVRFLKAWLSGAKTVMLFAEFRVAVRSAFMISAASVVISGLWLAAVTTGSMAIACMLPIPAAGIIPQSVPIVPAVSAMDSDGDAAARGVVATVALEAGGAALVLLAALAQAVAVSATAAVIMARAAWPRQGRPVSVARIVPPGQETGRRQGWRKRTSPVLVVTRRRAGFWIAGAAIVTGGGGELPVWESATQAGGKWPGLRSGRRGTRAWRP